MSKQSHIERTAHEPRDSSLHTLTISHITQVSPTIRLIRLAIPPDDSIHFLPGQWLDLHPPAHTNIRKPGGFTITSAPHLARRPRGSPSPSPSSSSNNDNDHTPHLELAIQHSPHNPPAAYLFLPAPQLLDTPVQVRVGGSFVFPPPFSFVSSNSNSNNNDDDDDDGGGGSGGSGSGGGEKSPALRKVVLVAGGMGINPLVSMLSFIGEEEEQKMGGWEVRVLYGVRGSGDGEGEGEEILFLERIVGLFRSGRVRGGLRLFLTGVEDGNGGGQDVVRCRDGAEVPFLRRRMTVGDVEEAVGKDKEAAVVYVCGVPTMTDEFVEALVSPEGFGMDQSRVLYEKWW